MILRDHLAVDRTHLANQRTLLSMLRTGLYFIVMGLTIMTIPELKGLHPYSVLFFITGGGFITAGYLNFKRMKKRIASVYSEQSDYEK